MQYKGWAIDVAMEERGEGDILLTITPRDPYAPTALSYAEAVKGLASRMEGVRNVTIICRNHIMADLISLSPHFSLVLTKFCPEFWGIYPCFYVFHDICYNIHLPYHNKTEHTYTSYSKQGKSLDLGK
ncbi:MAG: hypothetical protein QW756_00165 [Nitrososphaerota archaeon]